MKKQFLVNIVLLVFLNALIKPFWVLGIDRSVQNFVGSEAYGLYFALFNFSILFNVFLDLGITGFNNRSIAQTPDLIKNYFPRLVVSKLMLGFVYLIICLIISLLAGYSDVAVKLVGILAFNQFLASLVLYLRSNISGLQFYITDSILSVADRFLMIIFCGILLWTQWLPVKLNIFGFALLQTLAYGITCFIALIIVLKKSGTISFKNIPLFSGGLFRKSLPFALLGLLMVMHNRIDAVFLERLLPDGAIQAGIYAQSFRIFDAITMISVVFASLLLPMFSKILARKESIKPLAGMAFSFLFTGTAILAINLSGYALPLLDVLYVELYPESVRVFILLVLCSVPVSLSYIFGTLLTADGNLLKLNIIAGITLILNISLNLLLIPTFGVTGAAVSALITQLFAATAQLVICKKRFDIRVSLKSVTSFLLLFICAWLFLSLIKYFQFPLFWGLLLSLSFSFFLSFLLKIINLKEIVLLFRPEQE